MLSSSLYNDMHKMKAADKRNVERRLINRVPLLGILWLRNSKRSSMRDQNSKTLGQNLSRNKYVHRVGSMWCNRKQQNSWWSRDCESVIYFWFTFFILKLKHNIFPRNKQKICRLFIEIKPRIPRYLQYYKRTRL